MVGREVVVLVLGSFGSLLMLLSLVELGFFFFGSGTLLNLVFLERCGDEEDVVEVLLRRVRGGAEDELEVLLRWGLNIGGALFSPARAEGEDLFVSDCRNIY